MINHASLNKLFRSVRQRKWTTSVNANAIEMNMPARCRNAFCCNTCEHETGLLPTYAWVIMFSFSNSQEIWMFQATRHKEIADDVCAISLCQSFLPCLANSAIYHNIDTVRDQMTDILDFHRWWPLAKSPALRPYPFQLLSVFNNRSLPSSETRFLKLFALRQFTLPSVSQLPLVVLAQTQTRSLINFFSAFSRLNHLCWFQCNERACPNRDEHTMSNNCYLRVSMTGKET